MRFFTRNINKCHFSNRNKSALFKLHTNNSEIVNRSKWKFKWHKIFVLFCQVFALFLCIVKGPIRDQLFYSLSSPEEDSDTFKVHKPVYINFLEFILISTWYITWFDLKFLRQNFSFLFLFTTFFASGAR